MKNLPLSKVMDAVDTHMNIILLLKKCLGLLPMLFKAVQGGDATLFGTARDLINEPVWEAMLTEINKVIVDDISPNNNFNGFIQRCYSVKQGINTLLDIARKSFSEKVEDLRNNIKSLAETHGLDLRMNYTNDKGFHIVLYLHKGQKFSERDLPPEFNLLQKNRHSITMTTIYIMAMDGQLKEMQKEIQIMSNTVILALLRDMRDNTVALYCLVDLVSEIDAVQSLAVTSTAAGYVRPAFGLHTELVSAVHPVLEHLLPAPPVPNGVKATDYYNFFIITGPNSSGKSIFIRQIALLQIMAQIGCFIPAEKATFRICDKIFSRLGFEDSIELNASSYVVEMSEMNYILNHMTRNSLIIIDELCRATSEEEGSAVAWSICEEIMLKSKNGLDEKNQLKFLPKPFVFFTTHFPELTQLEKIYYNVQNLHLEAIDEKSSSDRDMLRYTHVVKTGKNNIEDYGIKLAGASNIPRRVTESAMVILQKMKERGGQKQYLASNPNYEVEKKCYDLKALVSELLQMPNTTKEDIRKTVNDFMEQNPTVVAFLNDIPSNSKSFSVIHKTITTPPAPNPQTTSTQITQAETTCTSYVDNCRSTANMDIQDEINNDKVINNVIKPRTNSPIQEMSIDQSMPIAEISRSSSVSRDTYSGIGYSPDRNIRQSRLDFSAQNVKAFDEDSEWIQPRISPRPEENIFPSTSYSEIDRSPNVSYDRNVSDKKLCNPLFPTAIALNHTVTSNYDVCSISNRDRVLETTSNSQCFASNTMDNRFSPFFSKISDEGGSTNKPNEKNVCSPMMNLFEPNKYKLPNLNIPIFGTFEPPSKGSNYVTSQSSKSPSLFRNIFNNNRSILDQSSALREPSFFNISSEANPNVNTSMNKILQNEPMTQISQNENRNTIGQSVSQNLPKPTFGTQGSDKRIDDLQPLFLTGSLNSPKMTVNKTPAFKSDIINNDVPGLEIANQNRHTTEMQHPKRQSFDFLGEASNQRSTSMFQNMFEKLAPLNTQEDNEAFGAHKDFPMFECLVTKCSNLNNNYSNYNNNDAIRENAIRKTSQSELIKPNLSFNFMDVDGANDKKECKTKFIFDENNLRQNINNKTFQRQTHTENVRTWNEENNPYSSSRIYETPHARGSIDNCRKNLAMNSAYKLDEVSKGQDGPISLTSSFNQNTIRNNSVFEINSSIVRTNELEQTLQHGEAKNNNCISAQIAGPNRLEWSDYEYGSNYSYKNEENNYNMNCSARFDNLLHQDNEQRICPSISRHNVHNSNSIYEQVTMPYVKENNITSSENSFQISQTPSFRCVRTSTPKSNRFE